MWYIRLVKVTTELILPICFLKVCFVFAINQNLKPVAFNSKPEPGSTTIYTVQN